MANIGVDIEALKAAGTKFNAQATDLQGLMHTVDSTLHELEPLWTGPAAQQFGELIRQWQNDIANVQRVLEEVSRHVDQASADYAEMEERNKGRFQPR